MNKKKPAVWPSTYTLGILFDVISTSTYIYKQPLFFRVSDPLINRLLLRSINWRVADTWKIKAICKSLNVEISSKSILNVLHTIERTRLTTRLCSTLHISSAPATLRLLEAPPWGCKSCRKAPLSNPWCVVIELLSSFDFVRSQSSLGQDG